MTSEGCLDDRKTISFAVDRVLISITRWLVDIIAEPLVFAARTPAVNIMCTHDQWTATEHSSEQLGYRFIYTRLILACQKPLSLDAFPGFRSVPLEFAALRHYTHTCCLRNKFVHLFFSLSYISLNWISFFFSSLLLKQFVSVKAFNSIVKTKAARTHGGGLISISVIFYLLSGLKSPRWSERLLCPR